MTGWQTFFAWLEEHDIQDHFGIAFRNWLAEEFDVPKLAVPWPNPLDAEDHGLRRWGQGQFETMMSTVQGDK
jgi:hypothetical protein